jgi:hypothetical protein
MPAQQTYLDDLERKRMVQVTTGDDGKKIYSVEGLVRPPAFDAMPYAPSSMSPETWRAAVLENFTTIYLEWWTESFKALDAQLMSQP